MWPFRGGGTHLLPSGRPGFSLCSLSSLSLFPAVSLTLWLAFSSSFEVFHLIRVVKKKDTSGRRLHNVNWNFFFFSEIIFFTFGKNATHKERREERTWSTATHLQQPSEDSSPPPICEWTVCAPISRITTDIHMNNKALSSSCCAVELTMATSDKSTQISFAALPLVSRPLRAALRHKFHFSKLLSAAWPRMRSPLSSCTCKMLCSTPNGRMKRACQRRSDPIAQRLAWEGN